MKRKDIVKQLKIWTNFFNKVPVDKIDMRSLFGTDNPGCGCFVYHNHDNGARAYFITGGDTRVLRAWNRAICSAINTDAYENPIGAAAKREFNKRMNTLIRCLER